MKKKFNHSSDCSYLYEQFDELIIELERNKDILQTPSISEKLVNLMDTLTKDSLFNTYRTPRWIRYSVRCFYCADILLQYMGNVPNYQQAEGIVNKYFLELVQRQVAAVLPQDTLDKYIEKCCKSIDSKTLYESIIRGAILGSQRYRLWSADEVILSYAYTRSFNRIVQKYIRETSDYSALNEWLTLLDTERLMKRVENYPNSANYKHTKPNSREIIKDMLTKMLEVHQSLLSMCHRNLHACIDTNQHPKITHIDPKWLVCLPTMNDEGFVPLEEILLTLIKDNQTFYLHKLIQYNIPLRNAYRDMGAESFTKDLLALTNGNEDISKRMQQFNDWIEEAGGLADYDIQAYSINEPITFFGVTIQGLEGLKQRIECRCMDSQYERPYSYSKDVMFSDIHVGELWRSYPMFDSFDMADDRTYNNYVVRTHEITAKDMIAVIDLPNGGNYIRVTEHISKECLPLVYYEGEGNCILVATAK